MRVKKATEEEKLKKSYLLIIMFLTFLRLFSEEFLPTTNGVTEAYLNKNLMKIYDIGESSNKNKGYLSVEAGFIIDNKMVTLKQCAVKAAYIPGTNIIKIDSKYGKAVMVTYIFSPVEGEKDGIYIFNDISDMDVKRKSEIVPYYIVYGLNGMAEKRDDGVEVQSSIFRLYNSDVDCYIVKEGERREKKIESFSQRAEIQNETGVMIRAKIKENSYVAGKREIFEINFDKKEENGLNSETVLDNSISRWGIWQDRKKRAGEGTVYKNSTMFLKQLYKGRDNILDKFGGEKANLKTTFAAAEAFMVSGHTEETLEILETILNESSTNFTWNDRCYTLYLISKYIDTFKDIYFLKKNYSKIESEILQPLLFQMGEENYEKSFLCSYSVEKFIKEAEFFIESPKLEPYILKIKEIKAKYGDKIDKKDSMFYSVINGNKLSEEEIKEEIRINSSSEKEESAKNLELLLFVEDKEFIREILKKIEKNSEENDGIIPEYVKKEGKYKRYGEEGIGSYINSIYIIVKGRVD